MADGVSKLTVVHVLSRCRCVVREGVEAVVSAELARVCRKGPWKATAARHSDHHSRERTPSSESSTLQSSSWSLVSSRRRSSRPTSPESRTWRPKRPSWLRKWLPAVVRLKASTRLLEPRCSSSQNPCYLWESDRIEDKRAVLKLTFAERLAYTRGEGFRTALTSSPFGFF